MWVFLNNAFLSIVAHPTRPEMLEVRARAELDIERTFPQARVERTPDREYHYRATVTRAQVARILAERVIAIDYTATLPSVEDPRRADLMRDVWALLRTWQRRLDIGRAITSASARSVGRLREMSLL